MSGDAVLGAALGLLLGASVITFVALKDTDRIYTEVCKGAGYDRFVWADSTARCVAGDLSVLFKEAHTTKRRVSVKE